MVLFHIFLATNDIVCLYIPFNSLCLYLFPLLCTSQDLQHNLNRNYYNGHPCLIPSARGEASISPLGVIFAKDVVCVLGPSVTSDSCNPTDYRPPGSSVHGVFQARIPEQVATFYSRGFSRLRDGTQVSCVSCIGRQILQHVPPGKPQIFCR